MLPMRDVRRENWLLGTSLYKRQSRRAELVVDPWTGRELPLWYVLNIRGIPFCIFTYFHHKLGVPADVILMRCATRFPKKSQRISDG
jgi:hypothetical protein